MGLHITVRINQDASKKPFTKSCNNAGLCHTAAAVCATIVLANHVVICVRGGHQSSVVKVALAAVVFPARVAELDCDLAAWMWIVLKVKGRPPMDGDGIDFLLADTNL